MEFPLVVGVDGSGPALQALDWAVDEAARHGRALRIVHASLWERYEGYVPSLSAMRPAPQVMAENILAMAEQRAAQRDPHVKLSVDVLAADPVEALVREGQDAFAVVVGFRGRGPLTTMLLGSVSLGVAGRAVCPTVVVRGAEPNRQGHFRRVLLGVGEAAEDSQSVAFAFGEARARDAELLAVHAWRHPADEASTAADTPARRAEGLLADVLDSPTAASWQVAVRQETVEGSARQALLRGSETADLLVVGARRRHGLSGLQLGLVNHAVLHHAPCPVAVVPRR
ncbi:universal stress protein [Streptomyces sp. NBC_01262]|uniref:universal stress protein n=1 Tax=Streptomyces sp. NBC_01262 TaxID=2903803 RepID=UPI002E30C3E2|nr:universal stress protein [Streptomyces sp. NBC_01262]